MTGFVVQRLKRAILMTIVGSIVVFAMMQLPVAPRPGMPPRETSPELATKLRQQNHTESMVIVRYVYWLAGMPLGKLGYSRAWDRPVAKVLQPRLLPLACIWGFAIAMIAFGAAFIGPRVLEIESIMLGQLTIVSVVTLVSVPSFVVAMALTYMTLGGLHGGEPSASAHEFLAILPHLILGAAAASAGAMAAAYQRVREAVLSGTEGALALAMTARGATPRQVRKAALRGALPRLVSIGGNNLPLMASSIAVVSMVMGLPTLGPVILTGLEIGDMQLVGGALMLIIVLVQVGQFAASVIAARLDSRLLREPA